MGKINLLIITILVVAIVTGGFFAFKYWQKFQQEEQLEANEDIAVDFQEGWGGDFYLNFEKTEEDVSLSWLPEDIKVTQIRIFDLGEPGDTQDHELVFFTSNFKVEKEDVFVFVPETLERNSPLNQFSVKEEFSEPEIFLLSPYKVGKIPQNFYDNSYNNYGFIFEKDHRYLAEVMGVRNETRLRTEYLFIF